MIKSMLHPFFSEAVFIDSFGARMLLWKPPGKKSRENTGMEGVRMHSPSYM